MKHGTRDALVDVDSTLSNEHPDLGKAERKRDTRVALIHVDSTLLQRYSKRRWGETWYPSER